MSLRPFAVYVALFGVLLACGMARPAGDPPVPVVPVGKPVLRQVIDHADFMARTAAAQSVEVRARVTGYLVKTPFKEGSEVKIGDVLFEIDPRPCKVLYDNALSQVELHKASLKLAMLTCKRDLEISRTPGAISQQQLDHDRAAVEEAEVRLKASHGGLDIARLHLDFTRVRSPINGKVSRYHQTPGNLVTQDQTLLTTIVSLDPVYVYFDMDERILLRIRRAINAGKPEPALLLRSRAVVVENGEACVFVVNAKDVLERRPVQLGPQQDGGLRVVRSGLTALDLVVLNALPGLKAGQPVQPKKSPVTEEAPKAPPSGQGQP